jgi:hypothetical protein
MFGKKLLIFLAGCLLATSALRADELGVVDCHTHPGTFQVTATAAKTPNIVASLPCGEQFTVLIYGEVFSRIQTGGGKIGYIYSYLVSQPDAETVSRPSPTTSAFAQTTSNSSVETQSVKPQIQRTQDQPSAQADPSRTATVISGPLTLLDGTPVRLKLNRTLSSADAHTGDQIDFEVLEEVVVEGVVVIPKGSVAIGTITQAEAKKRMARGGKLDLNIDYVRLADKDKAALRGVKTGKGGGHTGGMVTGMVATSLVVWPAAPLFLMMHGKDINIPEGTEITAYINGDMHLEPLKFGAKIAADQTFQQPSQQSAVNTPPASSPALDSPLATVAFRASPDGAEILVDGKYVGDTPSTLNLPAGDHTVAIKKTGYADWQRTLTVAAGGSLTINATLGREQ